MRTSAERARSRVAAFPVGLYGTLLFALCWLLLPVVFRPLERFLLGVACLPQHVVTSWLGEPALAAASDAHAGLDALRRTLAARRWDTDVAPALPAMPDALEPLVCRVLTVDRLGGGGLPCELRLDRTYAELGGCADFVTKGERLLGFVARPGIGTARDDTPDDPARVLLLNHPDSRPIAAALPLEEAGQLRCVVECAAVVDPAPLRTNLHEDPYRAARLSQSGAAVRTIALGAPWLAALPPDLLLGVTRVWGYDRGGGDVLTIGVYVDLAFDPRALSQVVLWQAVPGSVPPASTVVQRRARLVAVPDGTGSRFLMRTDGEVPDGALVAQGGVCLGAARSIAFGQALVTSFAASRQPWAVLLLPDDPDQPVRELFGEVVFADAAQAWFRPRLGDVPIGAGFVFTGGSGPGSVPGLLLGRAEPEPGRNLLRIVVPGCDARGVFTVATPAGAVPR